ncbi:NAD(P)/FAD-dependent oxidoreductase [Pseudomonas sp. G5(2012)]|uniref:NAD(P)/FAD-dependent oxidoreductase n=1 Tax=Pseudomonas sp. G5(2012) TaxID=1268068 RepID=UPI0003431E96|nr:FAD-dependent oxidoreductase [Pseudomonas sp. G5(2012)]EPA99400.1 FAD-dependent pyridine nucleotide-disulfide oxidoreductase [Pseudomonas sp. G5(2012)]
MNVAPEHVVIIGGGQAGLQAASSLREEGFAGRITLVGDEPHLPYQRPPLSKAWLAGGLNDGDVCLETEHWFEANHIDYWRGERVVGIDRTAQRLSTAGGVTLHYDHLILATGARNRPLPLTLEGIDGVMSLRSLTDATALQAQLSGARQVVIVGAGFLGLEAATVIRELGIDVQVVEATDRVMARALGEQMGLALQERHQQQGIGFHFNRRVVGVNHLEGRVSAVELDDGQLLPTDLVLVAIGVQANTELAVLADLATDNGVLVDAFLQTADASVSAIGDCACYTHGFDEGARWRLESVQNAVDQGRYVAGRLMGRKEPYRQVPIFWSEQAGCRLQMAGVAMGDDLEVLCGEARNEGFSVLRYRGARLVGVESVNRPADHMAARKLLLRGLSPDLDEASQPGFDLRRWLASAAIVQA